MGNGEYKSLYFPVYIYEILKNEYKLKEGYVYTLKVTIYTTLLHNHSKGPLPQLGVSPR